MTADPVSKDILAVCERAGLRVDTIDADMRVEGKYTVTFYPMTLPVSDAEVVRRACQSGRYHVRAVRSEVTGSEELERLEFVVRSSGIPF